MSKKVQKIVITAALPYANGQIHIGHLLEYIQADIYSRFLKMLGHDAIYICASDMHGTPVEVNARKAGKEPEKFANEFWKDHQGDFAAFHIAFDNYYKTHSPENKELAELFFTTLQQKGFIYTRKMNTIYCEFDKRYLPDRFVKGTCPNCTAAGQYGDVCENCNTVLKGVDLLNPKCSLCGRTPIQKESTHYFFSLGKFTDKLRRWLTTADVQPQISNQLREWISKGLEDWCISRDGPYFGFPIPDSKKETGEQKYFYVWLDAPIGYISSTENYCAKHSLKKTGKKKTWEDYWKKGRVHHFIGKDIVYFHYLFWPAMLMAMEIPLPTLTTHGFITVNGQKMSKSRGTFFTAKDFLKLYPAEALRFYYASHLDRNVVDVDLNIDTFIAVNNNVLTANIGNFCFRVLTFAEKEYGGAGKIASGKTEKEIRGGISSLIDIIKNNYLEKDFKSAVKNLLQIADAGNAYFQQSEVWKHKEQKESQEKVAFCVNIARNLSILFAPILPQMSLKIGQALGLQDKQLSWDDLGFQWKGRLKKIGHLVEKIEKADITPLLADMPSLHYIVSDDVRVLGVKVAVARLSGVTIKKKHEGIEKLKKELQKKIHEYGHEKILRLIEDKGKLPQINTVVDLYNIVSVKYGVSMATHDMDKLKGNIDVRRSGKGEHFLSLDGTSVTLMPGEVIYADEKKVIGRFSQQCRQTKTTDESTSLVLVAFGNSAVSDQTMETAVTEACELIVKFNGGQYQILPSARSSEFPPKFPLRLIIGKILDIKDHPDADSLYVLSVDLGKELGRKRVVAGLKKFLSIKQLLNRKTVFVANLKPARIRGQLSEAMILVGDDESTVSLLDAEKSRIGEEVHFSGLLNSSVQVTIEEFKDLLITIKDGRVWFDQRKLITSVEEIHVHGVKEGTRVR